VGAACVGAPPQLVELSVASTVSAALLLPRPSDPFPLLDCSAGKGFIWTDDPSIELPIRVTTGDASDPGSLTPCTLHVRFQDTVRQHGQYPALKVKRGGVWREWTYNQYYEDARRFGRACLSPAVDLGQHQGVGILAFNSPEWAMAAYGAIFAGGIQAGIYTTNTAEASEYVLSHCEAAVVVVDEIAQLRKVLSVRKRLPYLRAIVLTIGAIPADVLASEPGVYTWETFLALSDAVPDSTLNARIDYQKPGHCCALIYTSGTTGNPKAVMLSHDNLVFTSMTANIPIAAHKGDIIVSYLPLSHVAAQITDLHGAMIVGLTVAFAQPDALKGSLVVTLTEIRPHFFLGVPRVYEKIEEKLRAIGAQNAATSTIKKAMGDWAKRVGAAGSAAELAGESRPFMYPVANALIFHNIKKALGFDRCRILATGAAPIARNTLDYFASLGMIISEVYGMSESSGPHTANLPEARGTKFGTVGRPLGVELKVDKPDLARGEGEVCMRGRNVFMGYLKNPEATRETIDSDGWLHSGDLGIIDSDGFLRITGRIKELLITAGKHFILLSRHLHAAARP
jgi:long-chain-fatty-acid--CoA ligase ACSBG